MAKVIDFPGVTYGDVPVDDVLDGAKHLDSVIVMGWDGDDFYMSMSNGSLKDALLLVKCAEMGITSTVLE